jgi:pimeloyl-ACP methyl ester carboxylesterase
VLLTPATTVDSRENYGWNWIRALRAAGYPVCTSDQPGDAAKNMGDMQTRAEYVVHAIRRVRALAGRRIAVVGHSQGGMIMRWALRFWPDTRRMVRDVIGMAATNHGSAIVPALCATPCAPSLWQQRDDSRWTAALNSGQETFPGIDYTEIYSRTDEFVQPNLDDTGTSSLHGPGRITNVALQDICPTDGSEHLLIGTTNAVAWALGADALAHGGPADPRRVPRSVCAQTWMPGVDPLTGPVSLADAFAQVARQLALAPRVPAEPPLRCYVTASCPR